jgi:hypothetical protein
MQFALAAVALVVQMFQVLLVLQAVALVVTLRVGHLLQTQSQLELVELEQILLQMVQAELHHSMEWFLQAVALVVELFLLAVLALVPQQLALDKLAQQFLTQVRQLVVQE